MMDQREALSDARRAGDLAKVDKLAATIRAREQQTLAKLSRAFADAIVKARPTGAKGTYVQKAALSSSMGPGVRVDVGTLGA